jgi:hypothetical protein
MPAILSGQLKLAGLNQQITTFERQIYQAERLIADANEMMAAEVAQSMVEALLAKVGGRGRPQRGDHLLEETLLSPENRHVSATRFTVGDPAYLDSVEYVKGYWKNLEEGGGGMAGRFVWAFFGGSSGGHGGPATSPFSGPRSGFHGDARMPQYHALMPSMATPGNTPNAGHVAAGNVERHPPRAFQLKPIPAYHYLRDGGRNWLAQQSAGRIYAARLASLGFYRGR